METQVKKWGNSLALRIPKPMAEEMGLEEDSPVELTLVEGKLMLVPVTKTSLSLADLLAQVTPENLHGEVDTGAPVGREIW